MLSSQDNVEMSSIDKSVTSGEEYQMPVGSMEYASWYSATVFDNRPEFEALAYTDVHYAQNEDGIELDPTTSNVDSTTKHITRPKRIRTAFTSHQLTILEEAFSKCHYVTKTDRVELSNSLGLKDKAIKVWFQNRRMKFKKEGQINNKNDTPTNETYIDTDSQYFDAKSDNGLYDVDNVVDNGDDDFESNDVKEFNVVSCDTLEKIVAQCMNDVSVYSSNGTVEMNTVADKGGCPDEQIGLDANNTKPWNEAYDHQMKCFNLHYVN